MKELYEKYYERLVYFGLKLIDDRQAVEDIVIDTFVKLYELKYEHPEFALFTFVKNGCVNHKRNHRSRQRIIKNIFTECEVENEIIESGVIKILTDAVKALPEESRRVIEMYYFEEMTCVEIGAAINKLPDTVRSIKRYALARLMNLTKPDKESLR